MGDGWHKRDAFGGCEVREIEDQRAQQRFRRCVGNRGCLPVDFEHGPGTSCAGID